jgi:hypothetical protein
MKSRQMLLGGEKGFGHQCEASGARPARPPPVCHLLFARAAKLVYRYYAARDKY